MDQIFSYTDYRNFLKDYYLDKKTKNNKFSFRVFARLAAFGSPGYLKMIMDGQRNISHASIYKLVKAMKLGRREGDFFEKLVLFNQSQDVEEQKELIDQLDNIRKTKPSALISEYQSTLYSKWYYFVIWEMVRLKDFNEHPEWIANKLKKKITPTEASEAIERLTEAGMLSRTDDGKLIQHSRTLEWPGEVAKLAVKHYHHSMLQLSMDAMNENIDRNLREYSGLLISLSREDLDYVKESIYELTRNLNHRFSQNQAPSDVYHLHIQLFPLTNPGLNLEHKEQ